MRGTRLALISYVILNIFLYFSCTKGVDGKVEKRGNDKVYLVNSSASKIFRFTVKTTQTTDDSIYEYKTQSIDLGPGDEKYLGVEEELSELQYRTITKTELRAYLITSNPKYKELPSKDPYLLGLPMRQDTIIGGQRIVYVYVKNPKEAPEINALFDTVIAGEKIKYEYINTEEKDSLPLPPHIIRYKYKITGQLELTLKDFERKKASDN